jgi:thiamine biosynthesis lipoprotein
VTSGKATTEGKTAGGTKGAGTVDAAAVAAEEEAAAGPVTRSRYTMGTTARVTVEAADRPSDAWAGLADEALDRIDEVDRSASLYKQESDLCRLNAAAYPGPYRCGPIVAALLEASERIVRVTDGAFDPTVKPLMDQLGFYREIGSRADPGGIPGALAKTGWRRLAWDGREGTVRFLVPGMALDFGGIAKGYALDRAAEALRAGGVRRAQLELGRSWFFIGSDPEGPGRRFPLMVAAPSRPGKEQIAGAVLVSEGSVATSSPLGQTRPRGGGIVGHIVDPRKGAVRPRVAAVVVWAPTGTDADALTKAFVLKGPQAAEGLEGHARYEAAVILADGVSGGGAGKTGPMRRIGKSRGRDVYATPGLVWIPVADSDPQGGEAAPKTSPP